MTSTRSPPSATGSQRLPTAGSPPSGRCRRSWHLNIPGSGPISTAPGHRCFIWEIRKRISTMETRAPFVIVGAFVLAAILAVFGFVYWLNNAGGIGKRESYQLVFNGPVPGLLVGAAVLFNGIRVGEVTALELVADRPRDVHVSVAVAEHTPVRADTKVSLDF